MGVAPSGEQSNSCEATEGVCGTFAVNPKSIGVSAEYASCPTAACSRRAPGRPTRLIDYHPYGCGVDSASRARPTCAGEQ